MIARVTQLLLDLSNDEVDRSDFGNLMDAVHRVTAGRVDFTCLNVVAIDEPKGVWRRITRRDRQGRSVGVRDEEGKLTSGIRELAGRYATSAQVVADYTTDADAVHLPRLADEKLRSGMHVYLRDGEGLIGILSVQHTDRKFYTDTDAWFLFELGQTVALPLFAKGGAQEAPCDHGRLVGQPPIETPRPKEPTEYEGIIGSSAVMRRFLAVVDRVAQTDATVLVLGETGSGKELVARALHRQSRRSKKRLVTVNCAGLARDLVSSELFGHEAGAFTGARGAHKGRFEIADGGTLLLDEIGDIPPETQVRLLRVLEEGEFERVGSSKTLCTSVRIIAATHRNLEEMVEVGTFRSDLFFRLNTFPVRIPPLRERGNDIVELAEHFVRLSANRLQRTPPVLSPEVIQVLDRCHWIGNVRELRNVIERSVILCDSAQIELRDLPEEMTRHLAQGDAHVGASISERAVNLVAPIVDLAPSDMPEDEGSFLSLEEATRSYILRALTQCNGKISGESGAAQLLNINPKTLESKMRKLGIRRQWHHGRV